MNSPDERTAVEAEFTAPEASADSLAMAGLFAGEGELEEMLLHAFEIHVRRVLVQAIDSRREDLEMNKREFAAMGGLEYAHVRRLLTMDEPNPRVSTLARALYAAKLSLTVTDEDGRELVKVNPGDSIPLPA